MSLELSGRIGRAYRLRLGWWRAAVTNTTAARVATEAFPTPLVTTQATEAVITGVTVHPTYQGSSQASPTLTAATTINPTLKVEASAK